MLRVSLLVMGIKAQLSCRGNLLKVNGKCQCIPGFEEDPDQPGSCKGTPSSVQVAFDRANGSERLFGGDLVVIPQENWDISKTLGEPVIGPGVEPVLEDSISIDSVMPTIDGTLIYRENEFQPLPTRTYKQTPRNSSKRIHVLPEVLPERQEPMIKHVITTLPEIDFDLVEPSSGEWPTQQLSAEERAWL